MNITTESSREQHQEFLKALANAEPIHGWSVQCLDCDAYLWHHSDHEDVKLYLSPFFEGYARVLLTVCPRGGNSHTGDPTNVFRQSLTLDEFRVIATRMIETAMNLGKLPDTRTVEKQPTE